MKKTILAAILAAAAFSARAAWKNLDEQHWVSGPKIAESDLYGKVVVLYNWGPAPEEKLLQRIEQIWSSFKSKPCILVGSSRSIDSARETAKKNKLTFSVYAGAHPEDLQASNGRNISVFSHRGKLLYGGTDDRAATEALVNALGDVGKLPSLSGSFLFGPKSPLKAYEKQLVLGKPVDSIIKKLEKDVAAGGKKGANDKVKDLAADASSLLSSIREAKGEIKQEINAMKKANPEEALKLATLYAKSFPKDEDNYKSELPEMKKEAAAWKAAQKEAAKAAKAK